jgi:hypothetical protein
MTECHLNPSPTSPRWGQLQPLEPDSSVIARAVLPPALEVLTAWAGSGGAGPGFFHQAMARVLADSVGSGAEVLQNIHRRYVAAASTPQ